MGTDDESHLNDIKTKAENLPGRELLTNDKNISESDDLRILHNDKVYPIELELQYEELRHAWAMAEVMNEKYSELYDFAPSGFTTLSKDGLINEINLYGSQLLGRDRSRLKKANFGFFISDETKPVFNNFLEKVFSGKAKESSEVTIISDDKTYKHLFLTGIVARDSEYCIVTMVDFTDRLRIEKDLRESEEKYRRFFERANYGIFQSTPEGRAISVNPAFVSMFGYDSAEDVLESITDVSREIFADPNRRKEIIRLMKENPDLKTFENIYKRKDGTFFTGILNLIPIFDDQGKLSRLEGFIEDITARKMAEERLKESEIKYRGLVENSPDAITIYVDGLIVFVNRASLALMGADSIEQLIGKPVIEFVHPDYRSIVVQRMQRMAMEETVLPLTEEKFIRLDGSLVDVEVKAVPVLFENKPAVQLIIRDITARKLVDDQLRRLNNTLEERVAKRTILLESMNKELGFYIKEVEQFNFIVSHDLREPLLTLATFTKLLHNEYAGKLDDDGNRYIDFISQSAERMSELIKGLLMFSLIGKDRTLELVDCNSIVRDVLSELEGAVTEAKARIEVGELPAVNGCASEFRQLFLNLLKNAIKFRTNNIPPVINISAESVEKEWRFSIKDNGLGIDEKDREKIFVIFKRMQNRSDYEGVGIGLALCKKIVELHGGTIWVESVEGKGSIFIFTIPKF